MDIARPDFKQKKERKRLFWIGAAVILAVAVFLVVRFEEATHHRQYVPLRRGSRAIQALVVIPKVKNKASVVILVHEIYGLSDWAKGMADELADQGFIVVAPDLLSGHGPNGGGYSDFGGDEDRVRGAISGLDPDAVLADIDAAVDYGKKLPIANGKIAVVGFSWGGWKSFAFATHRKDLKAVFVFYGTGPEDVTAIAAPVYGFYAGDDAGVDVTIPATIDAMKAANKFYDPVTYEGAEHGFMRLGEDRNNKVPANKNAHNQAFTRMLKRLREMKPTEGAAH
jgi:carboxymethylenebutenolidase